MVKEDNVNHVSIFHNIMWSSYKGIIFSELQNLIDSNQNIEVKFYQISETEKSRQLLSPINLEFHNYNYEMLYSGNYEDINKFKLYIKLLKICFLTKSNLIILPGYHLFEHWLMLLVLTFKRKKIGVFCDSTLNDRIQQKWKGKLKSFFFSQCNIFFAYGTRSQQFLEFYGVDSLKIYKDCQSVLPHKITSYEIIEQRKNNNKKNFLFVGRLSKEKRIDFLLECFFEVVQRYPNTFLNIVGEGEEKAALIELVKKYDLKNNVIFKGAKKSLELEKEYLHATCLVLPSKSEPWGLVVNEAMQLGCPAIVSDLCGCVPELIDKYNTGYSFQWESKKSLIEKMELVLSLTNDELMKVSINCLKVISEYTPMNAAKQMYKGIIDELSK